MWNLLKKRDEDCWKLRDMLEESAAARAEGVRVEEWNAAWPAAQRAHITACESCQEAAEDLLATREIFKGVGSTREIARPWFANRVMAALAAREQGISEVASTWLYERPIAAPNKQPSALAAQESLFESPPPANQDDLLVPVQENKP